MRCALERLFPPGSKVVGRRGRHVRHRGLDKLGLDMGSARVVLCFSREGHRCEEFVLFVGAKRSHKDLEKARRNDLLVKVLPFFVCQFWIRKTVPTELG